MQDCWSSQRQQRDIQAETRREDEDKGTRTNKQTKHWIPVGGRGGITVDKQEEKETRQAEIQAEKEAERQRGRERNTYTDSLGERRVVDQ